MKGLSSRIFSNLDVCVTFAGEWQSHGLWVQGVWTVDANERDNCGKQGQQLRHYLSSSEWFISLVFCIDSDSFRLTEVTVQHQSVLLMSIRHQYAMLAPPCQILLVWNTYASICIEAHKSYSFP